MWSGPFGQALRIDVFDQARYLEPVDSRFGRLLMRLDLLVGQPLLTVPERNVGMTPETLRAEIEARAGRTWPR